MLCVWHGLAKLRLHTSTTLAHLQTATKSLGQLLRRFAKITCSAFTTTELPRESAARLRRTTPKKGKSVPAKTSKGKNKPFRKLFNLLTYKLHALGDYVLAILRHGTTDNFSTQVVRHNVYYWAFLLTIIKGRAWASTGETLLRAHKQNIQLQTTNHKSRAPWTVFAKCKIAREAKAWDRGKHRGITSTQTFLTVRRPSYHQQRPTARYRTPRTLSDFRADAIIRAYSQVCVRQCRWPGFTCELPLSIAPHSAE